MSCLHYCCYCCCYCCDQCCPHRKQKPDKPVRYPHIEYKSPDQANQFVSSQGELEKLPLERQYVFAQPPSEGRLHHHPSPTALLPVVPVTEQPRRQVRSYTPTHSPSSSPVRSWRHSTPTPEPSVSTILSGDSGTADLCVHYTQLYYTHTLAIYVCSMNNVCQILVILSIFLWTYYMYVQYMNLYGLY